MQGNQVGFESSFAQHLDGEQRRAVLEALGASINPDSTLGEILDAAEALGWSEKMGELSLADLAEALLAPEGDEAAALQADAGQVEDVEDEAAEDEEDLDEDEEDDLDEDEDDLDEYEDEEEDEDDEEEDEEPAPSRRKAAAGKKTASKKTAKKSPSKKTAKKAPSKKAAKKAPSKKTSKKAPSKKTSKKAAASDGFSSKKTSKKTAGKKTTKSKLTAVDVDERMSLEQAAEFFLPYVEELGEATMQALEELTSVSRRKLRFHVGQLVKHGYLERHGMGRGTFYTRA